MAEKKKAVIFDIDGTLANCDERRELALASGKMDWDIFFDNELISKDKVNESIKEIYNKFCKDYIIIIFSGRAGYEGVEETTKNWLVDNGIVWDWLDIREAGDRRDDTIVKKEMYDKIKHEYDVLFCIDDRQRVVDMWREQGLVCLQCAKGDF